MIVCFLYTLSVGRFDEKRIDIIKFESILSYLHDFVNHV